VPLFGFDMELKKLDEAGPPSDEKDWVGFHFQARARLISVATAKLQQVCATIVGVLAAGSASPRDVHSLWSQLLFISRAVPALATFTVALRHLRTVSPRAECGCQRGFTR